MKYYKLTDNLNKNEIVREDELGHKYTYVFGADKWVRSAIMTAYMWPDDIRYGMYEVISKSEAEDMLSEQQIELVVLCEFAKVIATAIEEDSPNVSGDYYLKHCEILADKLNDIECKTVAYLHEVPSLTDISTERLLEMGFTTRIANSVSLFAEQDSLLEEPHLSNIKADKNAWHVMMAHLDYDVYILENMIKMGADASNIDKYRSALNFLKS